MLIESTESENNDLFAKICKMARCFLEKKEYFKFSIISEDAETFMLVANSNNNLDN